MSNKTKSTILSLDLGTKTGWATFNEKTHNFSSGMVDFSAKTFEGGGMRYLKFTRWLDQKLEEIEGIREVYFEAVLGHTGTAPAHVYGGFLGTLTSWCEKNCIPYEGINVSTIKKYITGKGNASKSDVIEAVNYNGYKVNDNNEADAVALLLYAKKLNRWEIDDGDVFRKNKRSN